MEDNFDDMSFNEICNNVDGFEETYERVCATSYSLMNKIEQWMAEKSEFYNEDIGFIVTPDLVAIAFMFFENFVEMPMFLTEDHEVQSAIKSKMKKIREIKNQAINDLSSAIFNSEKGFRFHEKWNDDEVYAEAFKEVKNDFHKFILEFYEEAKGVQKNETSLLMIGGLLSSVVESVSFSEPNLRTETQEIVMGIKNSWLELFT